MDYYFQMLKKSVSRIEADFDFSAEIDHNSSKGAFREQIIKKILRPFLPGEYGVSTGQAFDSDGHLSKQLDIVLYDALHSYIAPFADDFIYFPCESIYGNIEIKSKLNKSSLFDAMVNIQSLKALKRDPIKEFHVNPMKPLHIDNVKWNITATNEYFGIVFAYESDISIPKIFEHIKSAIALGKVDRANIPNVIVLFKERKIITRFEEYEQGKYAITPLKNFSGLLVEECKDSVLSEFLIVLFIMLRSIALKAMDIEEKSIQLHTEIFPQESKKGIAHTLI